MQSFIVSPPPPGRLGAAWLGLVLVVREPPPPTGGVASVGEDASGEVFGVAPGVGDVGVVVCPVVADGEPGAATGGGDSGATGPT
jgi:hypothetical protein